MMWCAECGKPMPPLDYGGWQRCCNGLGYWTKDAPLPKDAWWPVIRSGPYYLYRNESQWPKRQKPVAPIGGGDD